MMAISLISQCSPSRNVFSNSLTISAARGDETGTTRSMAQPYNAWATSRHCGVIPPMTLGVVVTV